MSAIKWTPKLLAECRNATGVVFGMMSADARWAIQSERTEHKTVETWSASSNGWDNFGFGTCETCRAYRLSPSYTPPELEEKPWVDVPVRAIGTELRYCIDGRAYPISTAVNHSEFVGYVYASGLRDLICRISRMAPDEGPAVYPVAVRFWKGDAK